MTPPPAPPFDLEARLRAVVPAVRLVRERHLRKLLHRLAEGGEPVALNPDLPLWIGRDRLRELDVVPDSVLAGTDDPLLLVTAPADRFPRRRSEPDVLRHYWRLLFRGAVVRELDKQADAGLLTPETARARLAALGPEAELEGRFVLEAEHLVRHGADDRTVYLAFVAAYAERAEFIPADLKWFFPSLPDPARGMRLLAEGVPFDRLFAATRPSGAADPPRGSAVDEHAETAPEELGPEPTPPDRAGALLERAERAAAAGNFVRAAILRERAGASGWPAIRAGLIPKLRRVLGWDDETARAWEAALGALARPAARGHWPQAAKALYDIQKVAVDLDGELSVVDPVEWARSLGRRPLRRRLTRARPVILHRYLNTARRHLRRAHLPAAVRDRLDALLAAEMHRAEERIRTELGPVVRGVLDGVGLRPANVPERVAEDKVVAELLDRLCEHGFLRFADLRDALSRNQLKLPDVAGPLGVIGDDPLLKADARLAVELDGVYHRAELYLRAIQRGMAAAFGTPPGRWVSKYVLFPFVGAFLTVEFAKYLALEFRYVYGLVRGLIPREQDDDALFDDYLASLDAEPAAKHHGVSLTPESGAVIVALGFLFLALLYWPAFRSAVWAGLKLLGRGLRFVFVTAPRAVLQSAPVRALRDNPVTRFVNRHFGSGLVVGSLTALGLVAFGAGPRLTGRVAGLVFVAVSLLVNTPTGRWLEDWAAGALSDAWRRVRVNLIPGLIGWLAWAFRELAGMVERGLYAVDEWFRFREGQPRRSLVGKAALALVWFPVAYLVRFGFTLLLEPQINPLKHFPVVTVSHKILLPLVPIIAQATGVAEALVFGVIFCIPGIFGFIAWELRENWRLYAANRPDRLPRVALGHHGETMRGLLRPGLHSGTVPGLFKRLRAAVRRGVRSGRPVPVGKLTHGLDAVAHAVALFADRELIALLRRAEPWRGLTPRVGPVTVGVQTISVELAVPELAGGNLRLAFDHRDGEIAARVAEPGWLPGLSAGQRGVLETALAGFAAMGAAGPPAGVGHPPPERLTWAGWVHFWDAANGRRG